MRTGQREDELHVGSRRRPGVVVGRERHSCTCVNELARWRIISGAEKVICSGNERGQRLTFCQKRDVGIIYVIQMIERKRIQPQNAAKGSASKLRDVRPNL